MPPRFRLSFSPLRAADAGNQAMPSVSASFRSSISWQMLLAGALGIAVGRVLAAWHDKPFGIVGAQALNLAGTLFLAGARALAIPLIVSSIVLGAVGLEPMRGLGKLAGKTIAWIIGSSLLAACLGGLIGACMESRRITPGNRPWILEDAAKVAGALDPFVISPPEKWLWQPSIASVWGWAALVFISLGFGYYRNQIEEGHGRLIARFCQALDEMLAPLLGWWRRVAPVGLFLLIALETTRQPQPTEEWIEGLAPLLTALATGWGIYVLLALPALLWLMTRINPWSYFRLVIPAALAALASRSPLPALPLTWETVRRDTGITNRVASVTLNLSAALGRDGVALGWAILLIGAAMKHHALIGGSFLTEVILAAALAGCGLAAMTEASDELSAAMFALWATGLSFKGIPEMMFCVPLIQMGGAAVSVFSHACGCAIIAYSEGERNLLSPPPIADPLDLALAPAQDLPK
jgi:proton glutamate symport protein